MVLPLPRPWKLSGVCAPGRALRNGFDAAGRAAPGARPFSMEGFEHVRSTGPGPSMEIENRAWTNAAFRKMHVEVAQREDGIDIVHAVFMPQPTLEVPLLSADAVAVDGAVTLAIVDPSPHGGMAPEYRHEVWRLQAWYGVSSNRTTPPWGQSLFSDLCVLCRPKCQSDVDAFVGYAVALALFTAKWGSHHAIEGDATALWWDRQRYMSAHLKNEKTRRMLEAAFGTDFACRYMAEGMFDLDY